MEGQEEKMSTEQKVKPQHCNTLGFIEQSEQYKDLYALVHSDHCAPCHELVQLARDTDIPTPVVEVPADQCPALADALGVEVFPSVVHLRKGKISKVLTGSPEDLIDKMLKGE